MIVKLNFIVSNLYVFQVTFLVKLLNYSLLLYYIYIYIYILMHFKNQLMIYVNI